MILNFNSKANRVDGINYL